MNPAGSADPTMEEILASIRKIISEDQDTGPASAKSEARTGDVRSFMRAAPPQPADDSADDIFELEDEQLAPGVVLKPEQLVSDAVEGRTSETLGQLADIKARVAPPADHPLEAMVGDMLRPLLKDWLDTNLPNMVEQIVAREIARISGRAR